VNVLTPKKNFPDITDEKKGMFSSSISINVPGSIYDGYIDAIRKDDAENLLKIIYERIKQKKSSSSSTLSAIFRISSIFFSS